MKYVIIDGVLQRSTSATRDWTRRAARALPLDTEEKPDTSVDLTDRRSDFEKITDLEEIE